MSPADGPFSVGNAFSWGWAKFQQNAAAIVVATLIYVVALAVVEVIIGAIASAVFLTTATINIDQTTGQITTTGGTGFAGRFFFQLVLTFVLFLILAVVQSGIVHGALDIADGKKVAVGDFFKFEEIGKVLIAGIIVAIVSAISIIIIIGPLIVAFFTPFYLFFILDKKLDPWEAIMASVKLVASNLGAMVLLILGVILAYIVGLVLCVIGLIVTMPIALLALTYAYRKFQDVPVAV